MVDTSIEVYMKDMYEICAKDVCCVTLKELLEFVSDDIRYYRYDIDNEKEQYFYTACSAMDAIFDIINDIGQKIESLDLDVASNKDIVECMKYVKERISVLTVNKNQ